MTESAPRPRQVTMASVIAGLGALLVLVNIFSVMSDWGSASLREEVEEALQGGPFGPVDISVETALEMLRIMLMVVAAGCVAAVVLAVYTARRHRAARIGLTVLAASWAVMSLALGLAGLLLATIAVGCVVLLWSAEARTWFAVNARPEVEAAGVPPPPNATSAKGMPTVMSTPPPPEEPEQPETWGRPSEQPPAEGPPQQPEQPAQAPGGYTGYGPPAPGGYQPYSAYAPPTPPAPVVPTKRPGTLTAAGIITIVMSGIALLGSGIVSIFFLVARDELEESEDIINTADDVDMDVDDFVTVVGGYALIVAVLSIVAIVVATLLLKNKRVRIWLVVLSAIAIVFSLGAIPLGLIWIVTEVLVIVFCFVGGAGAWFDAQGYAADRARQMR